MPRFKSYAEVEAALKAEGGAAQENGPRFKSYAEVEAALRAEQAGATPGQPNPWDARHGRGDVAGGPGGVDLPEMADDPALYLQSDWGRYGNVLKDAFARGASGVVDMLVSAARSGSPMLSDPRAMGALRSWLQYRPEVTKRLYDQGILKPENLPQDRPERMAATVGEYGGATALAMTVPAAAGARYGLTGRGAQAPKMIRPYTSPRSAVAAATLEGTAGVGAGVGAGVAREWNEDSPYLELALALGGGATVAIPFAAGRRVPGAIRAVAEADPRTVGKVVGGVTGGGVGAAGGAPFGGPTAVATGTGGAIVGSQLGKSGGSAIMRRWPRQELQRRKGTEAAATQILKSTGFDTPEDLARLIDESDLAEIVPGSQPTLEQTLRPRGNVPEGSGPAAVAARKRYAQRQTAAKGARTLEDDLYRNDVQSASIREQQRAENIQALRGTFDDLGPEGGDPVTPHQAMDRHVTQELGELNARLEHQQRRSAANVATAEQRGAAMVEEAAETTGEVAAAAEGQLAEQTSALTRGNKATRASEIYHADMLDTRTWWLDRTKKVYKAIQRMPRVKNIPITRLKRWAKREIDLVDENQRGQIPREVHHLAYTVFDEKTPKGAYEWNESIQRLQALDEIATAGINKYKGKRQWFYRELKAELNKTLDKLENTNTTIPIKDGAPGSDPLHAITVWRAGRRMVHDGAKAIRDNTAGKAFGRNVRSPNPTETLGRFWKPDVRGGKEAMDDFWLTVDMMGRQRGHGAARAQRAEQAMRDYILEHAANIYRDRGARGLRVFMRNYEEAMSRFPGIRREVRNVARRSDVAGGRRAQQAAAVKSARGEADEMVKGVRTQERGQVKRAEVQHAADLADIQSSAAALYAKASTADEAMEQLLRSPRRKELASELWREAGDPTAKGPSDAQLGLRRAFWDDMRSEALEATADSSGIPEVDPTALRRYVAKNKDVYDTFFDAGHRRSLQEIAEAGEILISKSPGQTRQRLDATTDAAERAGGQLFQYLLGARSGGGGRAVYAADVVASLVEKFPNIAIQELIREALMDPKMAKELARKVNAGNKRMVYRRLHGYLTRMQNRQRPERPEEEDERAPAQGGLQ